MSRFTIQQSPAIIILGNYVFALGVALALLAQGCAPRLAGSVAGGQRRLAEINACLGNGSYGEAKCLTKVTPFEGDIDEPALGCFRYNDFTPQSVEFVASPSGLVVKGSSAPTLDFTTTRLRSEGAAPVLKALGDGHYTRGCLVPATEAVAKLLGRGDVDPDSVVERMLRDVVAGKGSMRAEVFNDLEAVRAYQERHPLAKSEGACVGAIDDRLASAAKLPIQLTEDDSDAQKRKAFFTSLHGSWRTAMGPNAATPEELQAAAMLVYGEAPWAEKLQPEVAEKLGAGPNAWRKGLGLDACIVRLAHRIKLTASVQEELAALDLEAELITSKKDLTKDNDSAAIPAALSDFASAFAKSRDEADKVSAAVFVQRSAVLKRRFEPVFAACLSTQSATDARCDSLEGLSVGEREACQTGCRTSAWLSRTKDAAAECKNSWADKAVVCGQPGELGEAGHARCQEACRKSTGEASSFAFQRAYETCWQGNGPTTCEVASDPYTKGGYSADLFKTKVIDCSKNCATERRERLKREAAERAEAARVAREAAQEAARQRAAEAQEAARQRAAEARETATQGNRASMCQRCFLMPASASESLGSWCDAQVSQRQWESWLSRSCNSGCASQRAYQQCMAQ